MSLKLVNANIVVVAKQFNPSIVDQLWLVDNGIVSRGDFRPGCTFTELVSNVATSQFILFVSPEQLQFTMVGDDPDGQRLAVGVLGKLVATLPHTPYSAVGLNFTWHTPAGAPHLSRRMFFQDRGLFKLFEDDDARFGAYFSKNAIGCRLKLEVKPILAMKDDQQAEFLQFAFNFHLEIEKETGSAVQRIEDHLQKWQDARDIATDIMQTIPELGDE